MQNLTEFAWQTIEENTQHLISGDIKNARPAIHCLRFLRDSCQSRPESVVNFQEKLSKLVISLISKDDLLVAKIATEALPIVTSEARTQGIKKAFELKIPWLSETALRSCRHLAQIEPHAVNSIYQYIQYLSTKELLKSFKDLDFSLSLSDSLKKVRFQYHTDVISLLTLWIFTPILLFGFYFETIYFNQEFIPRHQEIFVRDAIFIFFITYIIEILNTTFRKIGWGRREEVWDSIFSVIREMLLKINFRDGFDSSIRNALFLFLLSITPSLFLFPIKPELGLTVDDNYNLYDYFYYSIWIPFYLITLVTALPTSIYFAFFNFLSKLKKVWKSGSIIPEILHVSSLFF